MRDKKLKTHGLIMTVAVSLHTFTILWVMVPSLITYLGGFFTNALTPIVLVLMIHTIAGIVTEMLGVFLIVEWRFRPPPNMTCATKKWLMRPLITLWTFALILGIAFYVYYYF
ncbi:MAG: hypothetical protein JSV20_09730 [Candidatus Bathyarchaeota archaeon]|nr:MAG: hypothetical protein JSV20_09730 [Candidatus Bathyarchaeota archaeon]